MRDVERRLVELSARSYLGTAGDEEICGCLRQSLDGTRLAEAAAREGMAGIVAAELQRLSVRRAIEPRTLEPLSRIVQPIFAHTGAHFAELLKLGESLDEAGLRVIVLKGGALLDRLYRRRLALRPLSDIDLLVDPAEATPVKEVLRARGFVAPESTPNVLTRGPIAFDLHTDVTSSERIRRRSLAFRPSSRRLWEDARPLGLGSESLLALSDAHQFLHSSIHALKHSYSRLIWLVDLALLMREVDWIELTAEAEASGTTRSVAYTCHILERALGVEFPARGKETLPPLNSFERPFVAGVARRSEASTAGELLMAFSIPSPWERARYLLELAYPRRKVLTEVFPRTPGWLLLPRRSAQLLHRGALKLLRILTPGRRTRKHLVSAS